MTDNPKRWGGLFHRNKNSFALDSGEIYNPRACTEEPKSVLGRSLNFRCLEVGALLFYNLCRWQIPLVHL